MNKIILHGDYYPVFKDISDLTGSKFSQKETEYLNSKPSTSAETPDQHSVLFLSHGMLTAEALVYVASRFGFSVLQTVILLLKNTYEGHIFLNYNIRPEQLSGHDLYQLHDKPESFYASFYEQLDIYRDGMDNAWELLKGKDATLDDINFESLVNFLLGNQVIRFPVSMCSCSDITLFSRLSKENQLTLRNRLHLTLLAEKALAEMTQIENVNKLYTDKYNEYLIKIRLKEEVLSYHNRKLVFAFDPCIKNEDELDACLYKYLVENSLNNEERIRKQFHTGETCNSKLREEMITLKNEIKYLYRLVSKNCSEVHIIPESEKFYPELYHFFLEANNFYNESPSDCSEAVLLHMKILILFSKVSIYRKARGMVISEGFNIEKVMTRNGVLLSVEDIRIIRRGLEAKMAALGTDSFTEFKLKYVPDDEMTEIHKIYLQKQIEFIDKQIVQVKEEIRDVMKLKFQDKISEN